MFDLSGKTALVTGGGQSVGAGIARALAAQGAHVVVNDIVAERAESIAAMIRGEGGSAEPLVFDVTDAAGVQAAIGGHGRVDILVNNAGNAGAETFNVRQFVDLDPADYDRFIDVNLRGVLHCCRAAIVGMYERGWGRVITISSGAGITGTRMGISVYGASKGGAIAFMRHLAIESAPRGVTANTLALGLMANTAGGEHTEKMARTIPVGRLGTPEDVAAACVWLASNEASWVTGKTITLDGGAIST